MYTNKGIVEIDLFDEAPVHRDNFVKLVNERFYDGLTFHRIIAGFMVQVGDPRSTEPLARIDTSQADGPGYDLPAEIGDTYVHTRGKLGAARKIDAENPERRSAGSQFYIVTGRPARQSQLDSIADMYSSVLRGKLYEAYREALADSSFSGDFNTYLKQENFSGYAYPRKDRLTYLREGGAPWLDFEYTIFGEVVRGMENVLEIELVATDSYNRPQSLVRIDSMRIVNRSNTP